MTIYEKLLSIQTELKAPKSQYNSFGKYNYRNCEDILEAVKPLCAKYKAVSVMGDEVIQIGERYYIKSTARLIDLESEGVVENTAYAREEAEKKGMDGSQVTGASSSYARKYALNGLFAIDDTKDSDTTNNGQTTPKEATKAKQTAKTEEWKLTKSELVTKFGDVVSNAEKCIEYYEKSLGDIPYSEWDEETCKAIRKDLEKKRQQKKKKEQKETEEAEIPFSMTD